MFHSVISLLLDIKVFTIVPSVNHTKTILSSYYAVPANCYE